MAANLLTGYSLSMPVYSAQLLPDDAFQIIGGTIFGTCFSIGSHFMMTAAHVIHNLQIDSSFHEKLYNRDSAHTTQVAPAALPRH